MSVLKIRPELDRSGLSDLQSSISDAMKRAAEEGVKHGNPDFSGFASKFANELNNALSKIDFSKIDLGKTLDLGKTFEGAVGDIKQIVTELTDVKNSLRDINSIMSNSKIENAMMRGTSAIGAMVVKLQEVAGLVDSINSKEFSISSVTNNFIKGGGIDESAQFEARIRQYQQLSSVIQQVQESFLSMSSIVKSKALDGGDWKSITDLLRFTPKATGSLNTKSVVAGIAEMRDIIQSALPIIEKYNTTAETISNGRVPLLQMPDMSGVNAAVEELARIKTASDDGRRAIEDVSAASRNMGTDVANAVGTDMVSAVDNVREAFEQIKALCNDISATFGELKIKIETVFDFTKPKGELESLKQELSTLTDSIEMMASSYERMQRVKFTADQKANISAESSIIGSEKRATQKAYDQMLGGAYDPAVVAEITAQYRQWLSVIADVEAKHKTLGAQGEATMAQISSGGSAIRESITLLDQLTKEANEAAVAESKAAEAAKKTGDAKKAQELRQYTVEIAKLRKELDALFQSMVNLSGKDSINAKLMESSAQYDRLNGLLTDKEQRAARGESGSTDYLRKQVAALKEAIVEMEKFAAAEDKAADKADRLSNSKANEAIRNLSAELSRIETAAGKGLSGLSNAKYSTEDVEPIRARYQALVEKISELRTNRNALTQETVKGLRQEAEAIQNSIHALVNKTTAEEQAAAAARRGASESEAAARREANLHKQNANLRNRVSKFINDNTKAYAKYGDRLNAIMEELSQEGGVTRERLAQLAAEFANIQTAAKMAGATGQTFFQRLQMGWQRFGGWALVTKSMMAIVNGFKRLLSEIKEIDTAMTELRKVTDLTTVGYQRFYQEAVKASQQIGATVSDTINAAADFARLGYNVRDSLELGNAALIYRNVGDGIESVAQASESLISTIRAFGDEAYSAMDIVDQFNEVGKLLPMPVVTRCLAECYIGQSSVCLKCA